MVRPAQPRLVSAGQLPAQRRTRAEMSRIQVEDSVLQRPNDEPAAASTVCPGQHVFGVGSESTPTSAAYSVVWWDHGALDLGKKALFGVRRDDLIVKDVARHVVADGRSRYDRWHLARADARDAGSVPSVVVETVHDWAASFDPSTASESPLSVGVDEVRLITIGGQEARPGGAAFGVLVHIVLAQAPFDAGREALEEIARLEARLLGMTDEDAASATAVARRVLAHDLLARARAADARRACRRETPVTCTLPDGTLVEGIVDLAFEERDAWTIIDYKTDRELVAAGEDGYRRQVALYASSIARATGRPASAVLVRI